MPYLTPLRMGWLLAMHPGPARSPWYTVAFVCFLPLSSFSWVSSSSVVSQTPPGAQTLATGSPTRFSASTVPVDLPCIGHPKARELQIDLVSSQHPLTLDCPGILAARHPTNCLVGALAIPIRYEVANRM